MKKSVSIGPTTIVGWVVAIGGLVPIIVEAAEGVSKASAAAEWLAIVSIVGLTITQVGRYLQSLKLPS